ncbi:hypothetical protein [Metapseudomonas resinovorans]|uniref:Uncharacterized protein n=1 Tax=Metapseudomonas resinovorans NBRC 106553 TaxID=1245471 RepID=S6AL97_METRE|nr:hypothetical protein [Pseudomonas resinovorans]BAN49500.1 hypothetical protein PCA10_37680 [Pseudomonas resinovorans NBRC 106553]
MNQDPHETDAMERELLEHYRCHHHDEPSAALDQRILAAAAAQAAKSQEMPRPSFGERLHAWFFGSGGRQRWALALAGFATLGIGLSLTLRTQEQTEPRFDAPPASAMPYSAPAPAVAPLSRAAAPASPAGASMEAAKKQSAPMADSAAELQERQAEPRRQEMAESVAPDEPLASLRRVLELQGAGKREEAQRLLDELQARYPQRDIAAELRQLEGSR